ncbi:RNA methyltransferase [Corynebacterium sp. 4HC-13]|uniref:TrmH family RNA methyltransferase n=1 Tax=Corynebacterium anserum TaxID=2684406 RepID=UPI001639DFF5|nr:RNA methyltransferase [Corynebacterium anserum]MBC2680968.1 RNA methyltransferase [Corynebacterium anserum]
MSYASEGFSTVRIEDPTDPRLDDVRDLNSSDHRPDLPEGKGLVIAEGPLAVPRLLCSRYPVRCVVGFRKKLAALLDATQPQSQSYDPELATALRGVTIYEVSRETLKEVVGFDMHRGLLAAADRIEERGVEAVLDAVDSESEGGEDEYPEAKPRVICVVEGVGDHENIGSIFRNAAGLGVEAVLFGAGSADPLFRRSVRVSMGHVLRVPFARFPGTITTWQQDLAWLRNRGYTIVAMTPYADKTLAEALDGVVNKKKIAIMVGAEGPGLTEHAMRAADVRAKIPMETGTDSLNVATAAAIGFYAARSLSSAHIYAEAGTH